jgi:hypothetical protein
MPIATDAVERLNRDFLGIRARLVELAAALDRIGRGNGCVANDPRMEQIRGCLAVLSGQQPDRAEQIQQIFSLPYEADWRARYGIPK